MEISNYFKHLNLTQDQANSITAINNFISSNDKIFILKGYAGTGKTTILKGIADYLKANSFNVQLMAPTGRAAKVLKNKTKLEATTVHSGIYNFKDLIIKNSENDELAAQSFEYLFPIKTEIQNNTIIIVDEASMLSNKFNKNELFHFGTNITLADLLTYSKINTSNTKIIFVGDPAQLPPVYDADSFALKESYFQEKLNMTVKTTSLKQVVRQKENLILKNAQKLRNLIFTKTRNELKFEFNKNEFEEKGALTFLDKYVELNPTPEIGNSIVIAFSNSQCFYNNKAIREKIFPNQVDIVVGDLIIVKNNNYHTYGYKIYNGDIAKVVSVSKAVVSQYANVYVSENGIKVKKLIQLNFKKVKIRIPEIDNDIECMICYDLLNAEKRDLTIEEMKALYINFTMRFQQEQKLNGTNHKKGSEAFKKALRMDPFCNALRVKYAYSITCHKAQGGEWDTVFVDYTGRISLKTDALKWCYTATTRGVNNLYCFNPPNFGKFQKLSFREIGQIGNFPKNSISFQGIPTSPFHKPSDHKCKSLKYWSIKNGLENSNFNIKNVVSEQYKEIYEVLLNNDELFFVEGYHKISGQFEKGFNLLESSTIDESIKKEILILFNKPTEFNFKYDFNPEEIFLKELNSIIHSICDAHNIKISNVLRTGKYDVSYFFITDSLCAYIQFYFKANGAFSSAIPKKYGDIEDLKFKFLIEKITAHAI